MMRLKHAIVFCLAPLGLMAAPGPAPAQNGFEGSVLFSPREQSAIEAALGLRPAPDAGNAFDDGAMDDTDTLAIWSIDRVQLSAVIYVSPSDWTLWLGGTRIEPGRLPPYFADLRVAPNYVDVSVIQRPGAAPIAIRLRPNQTFLVAEQRIIEGTGLVR